MLPIITAAPRRVVRTAGLKSSGSRITPVPDPDDDVEVRLTVLEREVARLREQAALTSSEATAARVDAAAARVLAAGADRDVSEVRAELRAHLQALNALRETQLDQAREMREGFAEMRAEMREGFAKQATGMAQITALLTMIAGSEDLS
jgi:chaperonin cofactor prefoldin